MEDALQLCVEGDGEELPPVKAPRLGSPEMLEFILENLPVIFRQIVRHQREMDDYLVDNQVLDFKTVQEMIARRRELTEHAIRTTTKDNYPGIWG